MRTRPSRRTILSTVTIALTLLQGPLHAQFAYVSNMSSVNISGYTINPTTGVLTPLPGSPFPTDVRASPEYVAVDPSGKFAYVANVSGNVSAYKINSTGALTPISGSPFLAGGQPSFVAVDPSGKFVYVAKLNNISGYTINPSSGALTPIPGSPFAAGTEPISVAVDPSGKFAYAANFQSANISGYTIDSTTGALTLISGSPFPAGMVPRSVAVDPSGKFAYVVNEDDNNVSGYAIDSITGALTPISGSPFPAGLFPFSIAVDPSGKFAYVVNVISGLPVPGNVSGYTINSATGALTPIPGSPFPAGFFPISVAVDPSGKFAYVANFAFPSQGNISGYTINSSSGALTPISGSPFPAGLSPTSVAFARCATPPTITSVSATPASLWPPNHKLDDVLVNYLVAAPCGEPAACTLSVASNEPVNNDPTSPDWVVLDAHHLELRAERSGAGTGRIYTIAIGCADTRGNSATQNAEVTVPHDQGH